MKLFKSIAIASALLFSVSVINLSAQDCSKKCTSMRCCNTKTESTTKTKAENEAKKESKAEAKKENKSEKKVTKNESK